MSQAPNVSAIRGSSNVQDVSTEIKSAPNGALLFDPDNGTVGYKPNGDASMNDVMSRALALGAKEPWGSELNPLANNPQAARASAKMVLNQNPHYAGLGVDDKLPNGKPEVVFELKTITRAILSQFGGDLEKMRAFADSPSSAGGGLDATSAHQRATGNVRSRGLGFPSDPRI